jgi:predicted transcriptional regulator of viral defense system
MRNTILTEKDAKLIEQVLLKHGRIVSADSLLSVFQIEYLTEKAAHKRIQTLSEAGWLRRIKRGLYLVIDNLSARSQTDISLIAISNALNKNSYVSLSYALNYYQMFDQYSKSIIAITNNKSREYAFDEYIFKFTKVRDDMYFGFTEKIQEGKLIKIAEAEKALIDYLYLDKTFGSASLVFEKLKTYKESLDLNKIQDYALRSDITIRRKIGFFLDLLKVNTDKIHESVKDNRGISRFTADTKFFNARWRIYYDDRITG